MQLQTEGGAPIPQYVLAQPGQPCLCEQTPSREKCPHFNGYIGKYVDCTLRGLALPVSHCTGRKLPPLKVAA